jgi:hypothetical protein
MPDEQPDRPPASIWLASPMWHLTASTVRQNGLSAHPSLRQGVCAAPHLRGA